MKQNKSHNIFILFFVFLSLHGIAQEIELLTVEEAVTFALENNYQIKIVSNDLKIDETSVSLGFAGIFPR